MKINKQTNFDMTLNLPNETIPLDAKLTKKQGYLLESLQDPKKYKDASNKNKNNSESKIYNISQLPMEINENLSPKDIVNEIYKDVLTRYECMQGNLINHNIGFMYDVTLDDERNVLGEEEYKKRIAFQKKLYETIQEKIHSVRTLGTVIDYSKDNYSTISNDFSNIVIDKFYSLYKNGMIYLEEKPMNYCSSCGKYYDKTQIDYVRKKHVNLYAMYRVKDDNGAISKYNNLRNTYVVATTIYPWTVAVSEKLAIRENTTYSIVEIEQISGTHHYIIEKDKVEKVMQDAFFTKYIIKDEITSEELSKFILISPMDYTKEISMLSISEELVSPDTNNTTGIRIILPEYSYIDFLIYKKLNIEIPSPAIDISSKILKGNVRVVGKRINEVNDFIISYLKKGEFVFLEDYIPVVVPVCRECKKELIYIAKPALYIRSNEEQAIKIKEQAIKMLSLAEFVKEADRQKINSKINQLKTKEIVKISDYGTIGIPLPIYKCNSCGKILLNDDTVTITKEYIKNKGITAINSANISDIVKGKKLCEKCGTEMLTSSGMIFNNFFKEICIPIIDEESSNLNYPNKEKIDVLIESRKDFLKRLKLLMYQDNGEEILKNIEKIIIHSDVSENTKIIAKPIFFDKKNKEDMENAITTEIGIGDVSKKYGTDILRLWGVLAARQKNIILNEQSIIKSNKLYKNLRKTIRYLLSNLQEFNPTNDYIKVEERTDLDKYIYIKLYQVSENVKMEYEKCNFDTACKSIIEFCRKVLCRDYFPSIKYRLYILSAKSKERMMTLSTMFDVFMQLVMYLEPIIPFTLEEAWQYAWHSSKEEEKNILMHRENMSLSKLEETEFEKKWDKIFKFTKDANKIIRKAIISKTIKTSQEGTLVLNVLEEKRKFLEDNKKDIIKTLNVSDVEINIVDKKEERKVEIIKATGEKCARCRNYSADVGKDIRYVHLCLNCVDILENK